MNLEPFDVNAAANAMEEEYDENVQNAGECGLPTLPPPRDKTKKSALQCELGAMFDVSRDNINGVDIVAMPDANMKLPETNNPPRLSNVNPYENLAQRLSTRLKNSNSTSEVVAAAAAIPEKTLASVLKSDDKCFTSKEENYMLKEIFSPPGRNIPFDSIAAHLDMSAVSLKRHYLNLMLCKRKGDSEVEDKMKAAMTEAFMPHYSEDILSKMKKDIHDTMGSLDVFESLGQIDELENVVPHPV